MKSIKSPHWMNGGTGITNFQPEKIKIYEAAIAAHPEFQLEISDQPMDGKYIAKGFYSLHCYNERIDLSTFWDTFRNLEKQNWSNKINTSLRLATNIRPGTGECACPRKFLLGSEALNLNWASLSKVGFAVSAWKPSKVWPDTSTSKSHHSNNPLPP